MEENYRLRTKNDEGDETVTLITPEQAMELVNGAPIAFFPRDERVELTEDGRFVAYEDARPR